MARGREEQERGDGPLNGPIRWIRIAHSHAVVSGPDHGRRPRSKETDRGRTISFAVIHTPRVPFARRRDPLRAIFLILLGNRRSDLVFQKSFRACQEPPVSYCGGRRL